MRLPKRTLILWGARLITADFLLIPVADWLFDLNIWALLIIAFANLLLCVIFYLRYTNILLYITPYIIIHSGFLIKKQITIKPYCVYGVKQIRTPVSSALGLSALIIYCEGKRYAIPPTSFETCNKITELIKKSKRGVYKT